jgi:AcrR family transcriptional regulator
MGRKSMAKERRAEIAYGLYRCIAARGYANTTVRDIARESNTALGVITHYFESKNEILYTLADHVFEQYKQRFVRFFESHSDTPPKNLLKLGIKFVFEDIAGDRDLIAVFQELINLSRHDKKLHVSLKKLYRRYRETVAGFLGECAQGANVRDDDLQKLAAFLVSASEGASDQWSLDPKGIKLSEMTEMAQTLVDALIEWDNSLP